MKYTLPIIAVLISLMVLFNVHRTIGNNNETILTAYKLGIRQGLVIGRQYVPQHDETSISREYKKSIADFAESLR